MTPDITDQSQETKKGYALKNLVLGSAAVLLAYAGLMGWAQISGPVAVSARQERLVSSTVIIERVLPLNKDLLAQPPVAPAAPKAAPEKHAAEPPVQEPVQEPVAAEPHKEATIKDASVEPQKPAAAETPVKPEDPLLKGLATLANGMVAAPVDGLYEDVTAGRLPVRKADGLSAFKAYKKPFTVDATKPVIAIAVQDIGLSGTLTETAIKNLPAEVSLIVSPYATALDTWVKDARAGGHEVWLSLPMESQNYPRIDTGPHTLLVGAPERENLQKLEWVMSRTTGYVGFVAPYQDVFLAAQNDARPILGNIYKRGLGFVDAQGAGGLADTMAQSMSAPYAGVNVWVDKPAGTVETVNASLKQLEDIAREKGYAAGVISANTVNLRELGLWLSTLKDKGFTLAPLSTPAAM